MCTKVAHRSPYKVAHKGKHIVHAIHLGHGVGGKPTVYVLPGVNLPRYIVHWASWMFPYKSIVLDQRSPFQHLWVWGLALSTGFPASFGGHSGVVKCGLRLKLGSLASSPGFPTVFSSHAKWTMAADWSWEAWGRGYQAEGCTRWGESLHKGRRCVWQWLYSFTTHSQRVSCISLLAFRGGLHNSVLYHPVRCMVRRWAWNSILEGEGTLTTLRLPSTNELTGRPIQVGGVYTMHVGY